MLLIIFSIIFCIGSKDYFRKGDLIDFPTEKKEPEYEETNFKNDIIEKYNIEKLVEGSIKEALKYSRQNKDFINYKLINLGSNF